MLERDTKMILLLAMCEKTWSNSSLLRTCISLFAYHLGMVQMLAPLANQYISEGERCKKGELAPVYLSYLVASRCSLKHRGEVRSLGRSAMQISLVL
jgi:hypothetical protein